MYAKRIESEIHPATYAVVGRKDIGGGQHQIAHRGTAFAVDRKGRLVTCWHVLYMDQELKVRCDFLEVGQPTLGTPFVRAHVVAEDSDQDLAVLEMEGKPKTSPVRMVRTVVGHGTSCCAFGHPLSVVDAATGNVRIFARTSAGVVSMPFNAQRFDNAGRAVNLYELDIFSHGGASGGAVFLPDGRVFGVVSGSRNVDDGNGRSVRSNLSVAIDIREAIELLKTLDVDSKP